MEDLFLFAQTFREFKPQSLVHGETEHHGGGSTELKYLMMEIKDQAQDNLQKHTSSDPLPAARPQLWKFLEPPQIVPLVR